MHYSSESVEALVEQFMKLPTIGRKTAQRLVSYVLKMSRSEVVEIAKALVDVKDRVKHCSICYNVTDSDPCPICSSHRRDHSVICVVEDANDVMALERTNEYRGVYHVLGGVISPLDGIGPEDLHIRSLVTRIDPQFQKMSSEVNGSAVAPPQTDHAAGDALLNRGETEQSVGETEPSAGTTEPSADETRPSAGTTEPSADETKPSAGTTEPGADDTVQSAGETVQSAGETEYDAGEAQQRTGDMVQGAGEAGREQGVSETAAAYAGGVEISEVILALNPNVEGDTTAYYISQLLKPHGVRITRIARGLPIGGDLEYADEATLSRALEGRSSL